MIYYVVESGRVPFKVCEACITLNQSSTLSNTHVGLCCCQVAEEIWVCNKQTVTKLEGDIFSYKESLAKEIERKANKK